MRNIDYTEPSRRYNIHHADQIKLHYTGENSRNRNAGRKNEGMEISQDSFRTSPPSPVADPISDPGLGSRLSSVASSDADSHDIPCGRQSISAKLCRQLENANGFGGRGPRTSVLCAELRIYGRANASESQFTSVRREYNAYLFNRCKI